MSQPVAFQVIKLTKPFRQVTAQLVDIVVRIDVRCARLQPRAVLLRRFFSAPVWPTVSIRLKLADYKRKEKTLPCLTQTGESFSLRLQLAILNEFHLRCRYLNLISFCFVIPTPLARPLSALLRFSRLLSSLLLSSSLPFPSLPFSSHLFCSLPFS